MGHLEEIKELKESVKNWEIQFKSYQNAFYTECEISKNLRDENVYLKRQVKFLEKKHQDLQIAADKRNREIHNQFYGKLKQ